MNIIKNKVVTIHYRLSDSGQGVIEDSHDSKPLVYLHGHGGMLAAVEAGLEGKQPGDQTSITVSPEDGYGHRDEQAVVRVSKSHVLGGSKKQVYRPGMVVRVNTRQGPRSVVVVKAGLKTLDVDSNHPLAGRTLTFDIEVVDVRDATSEEVAHGHVHGDGGVEH